MNVKCFGIPENISKEIQIIINVLPVEPEVCNTNAGSFLASVKDFEYGYGPPFFISRRYCREGKVIACRSSAPRIEGTHGAYGSVAMSLVHCNFSKSEICASLLFRGDGRNTFGLCQAATESRKPSSRSVYLITNFNSSDHNDRVS